MRTDSWRQIDWREITLIPNLLSVARILLLPLPVYCIAAGYDNLALILLAVGIVTDILDGYLARRLNQISELGKLLDPLADKIGTAVLVIALVVYRDLPSWAAAIIVARDVLILIGSAFFTARLRAIPTSNIVGKLTALVWTLLIISYLTPFATLRHWLLIIAVAMAPLSFLLYLLRVWRFIRHGGRP